jgi:hypothetical protein
MYAQEKGPVSLAGHPTPTTSPSPEKSWMKSAPSTELLQAFLLGCTCSWIGCMVVVAGKILMVRL